MVNTNSYTVPDSVEVMRCFAYRNRRAEGTLKRMSSSTGILVEGHVYRSLIDQGFDLNPETDNKSVYEPGKMFEALSKYATPQRVVWNKSAYSRAFSATLKAFGSKGTKLRSLSNSQEITAALKLEKSSGAPEFTSKAEALSRDLVRADKVARGLKRPDPCVAYHRVQHGAGGPKNRLVWGYPLSMTILESMFARPLIGHFLSARTPMAFGLRRFEIAARMQLIVNSGVRYGIDFSSFDATICPALIRMAFSVLESFFPEKDEGEQKVWETIIDYFINTPILMPDGYVYKKHRGVPSGSYFTQMIDSIVNFFVIQYASIIIHGNPVQDGKLLVLGDDSLFGLPQHVNVAAFARVAAELGLTVNVSKSLVNTFPEDVQFLGHSWNRGIVDRPGIDIAKRMAFPETVSSIEDPRVRIITRMMAYMSDAKSAWPIIQKWSHYQGPEIQRYFSRDVRFDLSPTGWMELSNLIENGSSKRLSCLDAAYKAILL